jgi:hypothetical protein
MFHLKNFHGYDVGVPEGSGSVDAIASVDSLYSIYRLLDRAFKI